MFKLDEQQVKKLDNWMIEQDEKVAKTQGLDNGEGPYYGSIGGAYIYKFIPTTLGVITVVANALTKEEIDLTEYSNW